MIQYAGYGKRLLAFLIDFMVINILSLFFYYMHFWYLFLPVWLAYFTLLEGSPMQFTLGKKFCELRVISADGGPVNYSAVFVRSIGKILSGAILGGGFLMALFSDEHQALHDKLANTYVIEVKNKMLPSAESVYERGSAHPQIVGISGEFAGQSFSVGSNGVMIGRDHVACQVVFPASARGISRHHCVVSYMPQTNMFVLNDIGSSYGTFSANGSRIFVGHPVALNSGERFYLGSKNIMFEVRLY